MTFQQRPQSGSREAQVQKTPRFGDILDIAWSRHGLKRVTTAILQFPTEANHWTTIVHATVETDRGEFSAIGDANPDNAGKMIAPHSIRFAESRAIARALRWATNAGEAVDVEMGDYAPGADHAEARRHETPRAEAVPARAGAPGEAPGATPGPGVSAPPPPAPGRNPALAAEWQVAQRAQKALRDIGVTPPMLPPDDADKADLDAFAADCRSIYAAKKPVKQGAAS